MKEMINKHIKSFFFSLFFLALSFSAFANDTTEEEGNKKFNVNKFIFDHIKDAHDWHIITIGDQHISIPLPIILYSENQGLEIFMSSRFQHGYNVEKNFKHGHNLIYNDFHLIAEGENAGKIAKISEDGTITYPLDLSITKNVFSIFVSLFIMLFIFISVANSYKDRKGKAPKGLQSFIEPLIIFVRDDIAKSSIGEKNYEKYMPYLLTVFFFIFLNNLMGLIPLFPFGANVTGNIAVTMTLAVITFLITTSVANKNYWKHIFNDESVPWWLKYPIPLIPLIEFVGIFIKPFVLMIRLFANITAGHIVALSFISLIFIFGEKGVFQGYAISPFSIIFSVFMGILELLVAFIQAYVFTLLSSIYFGMATEEHH